MKLYYTLFTRPLSVQAHICSLSVEPYISHCSSKSCLCPSCTTPRRITSIGGNLRAPLPSMRSTCACGPPATGASCHYKQAEGRFLEKSTKQLQSDVPVEFVAGSGWPHCNSMLRRPSEGNGTRGNADSSDLSLRSNIPCLVRSDVSTAVTMKNVVFWDIRTQFVLHRRHITSPLQNPVS
jgi:hypothetical protein